LTKILNIYMSLQTASCEAERKFSALSVIIRKQKRRLTMQEERLNYLSILSTEDDIAKSLPYEKEVKEHAAKK